MDNYLENSWKTTAYGKNQTLGPWDRNPNPSVRLVLIMKRTLNTKGPSPKTKLGQCHQNCQTKCSISWTFFLPFYEYALGQTSARLRIFCHVLSPVGKLSAWFLALGLRVQDGGRTSRFSQQNFVSVSKTAKFVILLLSNSACIVSCKRT